MSLVPPMSFAPGQPVLPPTAHRVHVWRIALDPPGSAAADLAAHLTPPEVARMARFRHERGARRHAVSHGALRVILGHYLGLDPAAVPLAEAPEGKPFLAGAAAADLEFNLTHSGDLALVAVTAGRPVGVDVERLRPIDAAALAERYFSPAERAALAAVAGTPDEALAFFQCWTRKEAFLKATGTGLHRPLDSFTVTLRPGEAPRLAWSAEPGEVERWSLASLTPAAGYVAAVATAGPVGEVTGWAFGAYGGAGLYSRAPAAASERPAAPVIGGEAHHDEPGG